MEEALLTLDTQRKQLTCTLVMHMNESGRINHVGIVGKGTDHHMISVSL